MHNYSPDFFSFYRLIIFIGINYCLPWRWVGLMGLLVLIPLADRGWGGVLSENLHNPRVPPGRCPTPRSVVPVSLTGLLLLNNLC